MKKSFVNTKSPILAGVIREKSPRAAVAAIKNCELHGADVIDLHLSCLDDEFKNVESIKFINDYTSLPVMALNYNQRYNCSMYECSEEDRVDLLLKAAEAGSTIIDFQGYTYDLESKTSFREENKKYDYSFVSANPKEVVMDPKIIEKQIRLFEKVKKMGCEVLLSCHPMVPMNTQQVVDLAKFLEERNPDMIKIVAFAENEDDMIEALKTSIVLKREMKTPTHFHCAGANGKLTRLLNPILGNGIHFVCDGYTESSNFEQLDLQTVKEATKLIKKMI